MKTKIIKGGKGTAKARSLTEEQRERKNARDRERRAERKRAAVAAPESPAATAPEAPAAVAPEAPARPPYTPPTPAEIKARQEYRDARIAVLAKQPEGETWAQRKARHRELDKVLREGGPHARPMRKRHASGMTGNGLVMVRPND
jgi:hypothetical protein